MPAKTKPNLDMTYDMEIRRKEKPIEKKKQIPRPNLWKPAECGQKDCIPMWDINSKRCLGCKKYYCMEHHSAKISYYCKTCMNEQGCTVCLANVRYRAGIVPPTFTSECLATGVCNSCKRKVCNSHTDSTEEQGVTCGICALIKECPLLKQ